MKTASSLDIVLLAGGTGGHVFPAQVLAEAFEKQGLKTLLVTDQRGSSYVTQQGSKVHVLHMATGNFAKRLWGVMKNTLLLGRIFLKNPPKIIIGFGGYPSAAGGICAIFLNIPLCLHEQNAVLGRVNRLLGIGARRIFVTFSRMQKVSKRLEKKKVFVGPLVRSEIKKVGQTHPYKIWEGSFENKQNKFQILAIGGSQGSLSLVQAVLKSLDLLEKNMRESIFLTLQVPSSFASRAEKELERLDISFESRPFFPNMDVCLSRAHLLICRSGSSAVAESVASKRPALFIPLPSAMDDHQTANASFIQEQGGGWVIPQDAFVFQNLASHIHSSIKAPKSLEKASQNLSRISQESGLEKILGSVDAVMKERHKERSF